MDKQNWNNFVLANGGSFLQSYEWGEFQRAFGRRVWRLTDDGWCAQFIEMTAPMINKKYWYAPRGPVVANGQGPIANGKLEEFIKKAKEEAEKEGAMFFRIGPGWQIANRESLIANGFKQLHYDIEPSQTQILDLDKSEDELLAQMHEKWRYNIRLAERKGVKIKIVDASDADFDKYFEEFYRLVDSGTSERKNINHHPKEYYRKQLEMNHNPTQPPKAELSSGLNLRGGEIRQNSTAVPPLKVRGGEGELCMKLFIAEFEEKVIAANIVAVFGDTSTYLHGATDNNFRNLMAPHLLQWEQIKFAKNAGCAKYDFWGIVNEHTLDKRGPSWAGFTRFKKGFGGREENYIGYFDYPVNKFWYFIYQLAQKIRR